MRNETWKTETMKACAFKKSVCVARHSSSALSRAVAASGIARLLRNLKIEMAGDLATGQIRLDISG